MCTQSVGVVGFYISFFQSKTFSSTFSPVVMRTRTVKTKATKRIAKRKIAQTRSSSANRDVAFHCHGYVMVKMIARVEKTNPKSVVQRSVATHVSPRTSGVLAGNVYRAGGSAITNRIVMTTVTSMSIVS